MGSTQILQIAAAQQSFLGSSEPVIKVLLGDAIEATERGNTSKTIQNLKVIDQMISEVKQNFSYIQAAKLLIGDAIQALHNNDTTRAVLYLNLTSQQLGLQTSDNQTSKTTSSPASHDFITYNSPVFGIRMQYPSVWSLREYTYNPGANSTLVGFYSPSKTASELGNISGVSGHFVPYLDIFIFPSKNMSLNDIVKSRINRIMNNTNLAINESKPISLKGNQSAYSIVYNTMTGGDELFKKVQTYTIFDNKVYLITFTSQNALFSNYLPIIQKMINSFEIRNSTTIK